MITSLIKYSALVTKTKAIYGKRLKPDDYQQLINMKSVAEIATFLKEHPGYRSSMINLDEKNVHRGTLEEYLREELSKEYGRILNFASGDDEKFLRFLAVRMEVDEILYFVRLIVSNKTKEYKPHISQGIEKHCTLPFYKFTAGLTFNEFVEVLQGTEYYTVLEPLTKKDILDYTGVEIALGGQYFRHVLKSIDKNVQSGDRAVLKDFFGCQIDFANFQRIIRSKKYFNKPNDHIFANLLPFTHKLGTGIINQMVNAPSWQEAYELIFESHYGDFFKEFSFDTVEDYYREYIFDSSKRLLQCRQASICVPVAYLNIKNMEIKNLINIIEGVRYLVDVKDITRHLVGIKGGEN